jgi:hypothetical protein
VDFWSRTKIGLVARSKTSEKAIIFPENFGREIAYSSDASMMRIDFSGLGRFEKICIISMYTQGQPYSSRGLDEVIYRKGHRAPVGVMRKEG